MPKQNVIDHQRTRQYIPLLSTEQTPPLSQIFRCLQTRCIHEGRVVYLDFEDVHYLKTMLSLAKLDSLFKINEQIISRFIVEFYSQFSLRVDREFELHVQFIIKNKLFSYPFPEFGRILGVSTEGDCSFTNEWGLNFLAESTPKCRKC